ncbi:UNVERIFIED_CONTAM: hypothetical protein GTU68_017669 [Idotea baltica]|nr:hypothetical protein [Idotea baltica]
MNKERFDLSALAHQFNSLDHISLNKDNAWDQRDDSSTEDSPENLLKQILEEIGEIKKEEFDWSNRLREDVGLDSLDMVELVMVCERDFMISLPDNEWLSVRTANDLLSLIRQKLPV